MMDAPAPPVSAPAEAGERARRFRGRDIALGLGIAVFVLAAAYVVEVPGGIEGQSRPLALPGVALGPVPTVGEPAPDLQVLGLDGQILRLSEFRGQPVWLNFWATWCPPCRAENPDIEAIQREFADRGLIVLAVSVGESPEVVRGYVERVGLSSTVGLDLNSVAAARYRVAGLPTHVFIDRRGTVRAYRIGALGKGSMRAMVELVVGP
jgi:cytochrome c biogenesis protein CcmG, thiol:disulfide interchange protein DsbE